MFHPSHTLIKRGSRSTAVILSSSQVRRTAIWPLAHEPTVHETPQVHLHAVTRLRHKWVAGPRQHPPVDRLPIPRVDLARIIGALRDQTSEQWPTQGGSQLSTCTVEHSTTCNRTGKRPHPVSVPRRMPAFGHPDQSTQARRGTHMRARREMNCSIKHGIANLSTCSPCPFLAHPLQGGTLREELSTKFDERHINFELPTRSSASTKREQQNRRTIVKHRKRCCP